MKRWGIVCVALLLLVCTACGGAEPDAVPGSSSTSGEIQTQQLSRQQAESFWQELQASGCWTNGTDMFYAFKRDGVLVYELDLSGKTESGERTVSSIEPCGEDAYRVFFSRQEASGMQYCFEENAQPCLTLKWDGEVL